jgi:hypothetical protein
LIFGLNYGCALGLQFAVLHSRPVRVAVHSEDELLENNYTDERFKVDLLRLPVFEARRAACATLNKFQILRLVIIAFLSA